MRRNSTTALLTVALVLAAPMAAGAEFDAARVERALDAGQYAEAESLAMEMFGAAEEGSLEAAEALGLALRAARYTGSIPLDVLPRVAADVLARQRAHLAEDDPRLATTYHELGNTHLRRGDADAAAEAFAEALRRRRASLGPRDPQTARSMLGLANARAWQQRFDEARELYEESLAVLEATVGERDAAYVRALNAYALLLQRTGDRTGAERRFRRALELAVQVLDADHTDRALVERNLGVLLLQEDRVLEAEPHLENALRIRRAALADDDLLVGHAAASVGEARARLGRGPEAAAALREAIAILSTSDADAERTQQLRLLLAQTLIETGDFDAAATTIDAIEAERGEAATPAERTQWLALRANRAASMGDYVTARPLYEEVLARRAEQYGEESAAFARVLHNHAEVLERDGDAAAAVAARQRAVAIQSRTLPPDDPDLARGRVNLASSLWAAGRLDAALDEVERAEATLRESLGEDHPDRANALLLRASLQLARGDARRAVDDARQGVELRRRAFGPAHVEVGWAQEILARALLAAGERDDARRVARASARTAREQLVLAVRTLPERQALRFVGEGRAGRDVLLELAVAAQRTDEDVRDAYDALVRDRALVLDEMIDRRRASTDALEARARLDAARRELLAAVTRPGVDEATVAARREAVERAETELARASDDFRRSRARLDVGAAEVLAALPHEDVLVATTVATWTRGPAHFVAFVVRRGEVEAFDLGPADAVDAAVDDWVEQVRRPITDLDARAGELVRGHDAAARALAELVWDPIEIAVRGRPGDPLPPRIWWVADGSLHRVQPLALVGRDGRWLALDDAVFVALDTERDLTNAPRTAADSAVPARVLAVGAPDFGGGDALRSAVASTACLTLSTLRFAPLPGTAAEVEELRASRPRSVTVLVGSAAAESTVTALAPRHEELHLATHGFFLDAECVPRASAASAADATRGIGGVVRRRDDAPRMVRADARTEGAELDPLLRAGLALAGANARGSSGDPAHDGLWLAEEIVALDLSRVRTVVLSACDTATGAVVTGEGVLGLRRAFRRAGAGDVVMSLWPVQDEATRAWMRAFHRARAQGLDTARAVTEASRVTIAARRDAGLDPHPFFWAPFVCSGRP